MSFLVRKILSSVYPTSTCGRHRLRVQLSRTTRTLSSLLGQQASRQIRATLSSAPETMTDWTPPAHGSPCWIDVLALNIPRARDFYGTVFNWTFKNEAKNAATGEVEFVAFRFPEPKLGDLGGGFRKVEKLATGGSSTVETTRLFFYVEDLEKTMDAIVANGGKKKSEVEPESDFGLMMDAEDSEGNPIGIYTMKNKG